MHILPNVNGHDDLVRLNDRERELLCDEIRQFLIFHVSQTGGHLASNLGVVELSVAIETVFDTMKDRLVFDVGHQSYVHKMLTRRQADFEHLRQFGGIAGFPKPSESDSDAFVAGHASSSVSIALGMARARTMQNQDYEVLAMIGDGAATGGMAYEGLNDAAMSKEPMVIILNDNEMSIDRNVGGMAWHLSRIRSSDEYLKLKAGYRRTLEKIPGGKSFYRFSSRVKNRIKRLVLPSTIFENMGLTYLGPVDGHDLPDLIDLLRAAKELRTPVLVHVLTQKGYGYQPAMENPSKFHGIGKFDPVTGATPSGKGKTYSDVFGETMAELAGSNPKVCAITAAMPTGTGLLQFREKFPGRLFDVGIAEEHAVSMAGGLAKQGMVPVVAIYSTFLQRAYDQILQDVAMLNLHVVFAVDRAGLVGDDGETHHGVFDAGFLHQIPGLTVLSPSGFDEFRSMLHWAVNECTGPVAVRYPRGGDAGVANCVWTGETGVVSHRHGSDGAIVTYGRLVNEAMAAADALEQRGIHISVVRLARLKPVPISALEAALTGQKLVLIAEEAMGGIGSELCSVIRDVCPETKVMLADLGDEYVTHGSVGELYRKHGLDGNSLADRFMEVRQS